MLANKGRATLQFLHQLHVDKLLTQTRNVAALLYLFITPFFL
jgi:hypothetical protein